MKTKNACIVTYMYLLFLKVQGRDTPKYVDKLKKRTKQQQIYYVFAMLVYLASNCLGEKAHF